jgi:hypothetical protein
MLTYARHALSDSEHSSRSSCLVKTILPPEYRALRQGERRSSEPRTRSRWDEEELGEGGGKARARASGEGCAVRELGGRRLPLAALGLVNSVSK